MKFFGTIAAVAMVGTAVTMKINKQAKDDVATCQISKFEMYHDKSCRDLITVNNTRAETNMTMVQNHVASWEDAIKNYAVCSKQDDNIYTKVSCDDHKIVSAQFTDDQCKTPKL